MMIIVSGLPGSGKTHLASRLASKLGAEYISSDLTRKEIESRGEYAFEDNLTVYEEMARRAGDELRHGNTVVIDATFYLREMRSLFSTLAALLHKKVCNIELFVKHWSRGSLTQKPQFSFQRYSIDLPPYMTKIIPAQDFCHYSDTSAWYPRFERLSLRGILYIAFCLHQQVINVVIGRF